MLAPFMYLLTSGLVVGFGVCLVQRRGDWATSVYPVCTYDFRTSSPFTELPLIYRMWATFAQLG